ncbi:MAG: glycosyltransferase [Rhodospirillales bacterium]|nr:glycosyltransferase [Rhodospirillales bacterium]
MENRADSIARYFDALAPERDEWIKRNAYFHEEDAKYMRFLIPEGSSVLEIGCGTGHLLAALNPSRGAGVDMSVGMVKQARKNHPEYEFECGDVTKPEVLKKISGPFDYVVLSDTIGLVEDCQAALSAVQAVCDRETRVVIAFYGYHWDPVLKLGTKLGLKMPQPEQNWLAPADIGNLLELADFDVIGCEWRLLLPKRLGGIGPLVNRLLGTLPLIRRLGLRNYVVARSVRDLKLKGLSASVLVPCRNEKGNIEAAVTRLPQFCKDLEVIFIEGHSQDGTYKECLRVQEKYANRKIQVLRQPGIGKGDAMRVGYDAATGDVLIILDADLTVPPEDIPKFYDAIVSGKGEYINGTRLVYPMEGEAMRFLNLLANWAFARIFTYLLNQRLTDTLCGTKVLRRVHYDKIARNRNYFGDFDPFGDFDLLFGATKLGLKMIEVPIRYRDRQYGKTQISRFSHGLLLVRMVFLAFIKMKAL